jgi:hypothetical protein
VAKGLDTAETLGPTGATPAADDDPRGGEAGGVAGLTDFGAHHLGAQVLGVDGDRERRDGRRTGGGGGDGLDGVTGHRHEADPAVDGGPFEGGAPDDLTLDHERVQRLDGDDVGGHAQVAAGGDVRQHLVAAAGAGGDDEVGSGGSPGCLDDSGPRGRGVSPLERGVLRRVDGDDTGLGAVGDDTRGGRADDDRVQVAGTQATGEGQRLAGHQ